MRFLVVGAAATGGYFGGRLLEAGRARRPLLHHQGLQNVGGAQPAQTLAPEDTPRAIPSPVENRLAVRPPGLWRRLVRVLFFRKSATDLHGGQAPET
jgi:hypothetical protein